MIFANRFKCFDFSMMSQLYVLQYPLRPSWRAYEMDERCQEVSVVPFCFCFAFSCVLIIICLFVSFKVRVNPSTSEVEIDLSMDVHSTNYDSKSASELHITKQVRF